MDDPLVGTTLGPCRLEALVGRGGMGRVYRARHLTLDRVVAVKLVDRAGPEGAAALAEARAAAKLDDPSVVAVYEVGSDKGAAFIVMQWVDGESLEARVSRSGPLSPQEALRVVGETAQALRAAHAAGLVHRDVKPANILLDSRGGVKLTDFGMAGAVGAADSGDSAGSFHFMAPEQGYGAPPDPRADLYALGATWFYALTGRPPFTGSPADALVRHRDEAAPDVRTLRPEATARCAGLIARLMSKDSAARPSGADEVLRELADPGMVLNVDPAGSPFRLLPPPAPAPSPAARPEASAPEAPHFVPAPPPPPAPAAPALGSRASFYVFGGILGLAAVAWPWRRPVAEDWLAGTAVFAAFPALLTFGERGASWHKLVGAACDLAAAACFARYVRAGLGTPPLETLIVAGFGAVAAVSGAYLSLWGTDVEEVLWGRILAPLGGLLLGIAGLTWSVPPGRGWSQTLATEAARGGREWLATGGAWRWGGLVALAIAAGAARRLKTVSDKPAEGRRLNWNR